MNILRALFRFISVTVFSTHSTHSCTLRSTSDNLSLQIPRTRLLVPAPFLSWSLSVELLSSFPSDRNPLWTPDQASRHFFFQNNRPATSSVLCCHLPPPHACCLLRLCGCVLCVNYVSYNTRVSWCVYALSIVSRDEKYETRRTASVVEQDRN